jgi:hypothetical protein
VKRLAPVSDFPERLVPYEEINCLEITTSKRGRHAYRLGEIVNNKKKKYYADKLYVSIGECDIVLIVLEVITIPCGLCQSLDFLRIYMGLDSIS